MCKYIIIAIASLMPLQVIGAEHPTALELLDKYAATQNQIYKSFIMKFEASIDGYRSHTYILERGKRKGGVDSEIRFDGIRFYWSREMWANCFPSAKKFTPKDDPRTKWELWDGSIYYTGGKEPDWLINEAAEKGCKTIQQREQFIKSRCIVTIRNNFDSSSHRGKITRGNQGKINLHKLDFYFPDMCGGGGYYYNPQLVSELRNTDKLTVRDKTEDIDGCQCYVIEAADKESKYKLGIDPNHGYNIAKFQQLRRRVEPDTSTSTIRTKVKNVRFQKIGDVWVPVELDYSYHSNHHKGRFIKSTTHIKRTEVILNPDHDALGSFIFYS